MSNTVTEEYRIVYNWGISAHEIVLVQIINNTPYGYSPAEAVYTHDEEASLGLAEEPVTRLRDHLHAMLAACDKPVLRFPEDFEG